MRCNETLYASHSSFNYHNTTNSLRKFSDPTSFVYLVLTRDTYWYMLESPENINITSDFYFRNEHPSISHSGHENCNVNVNVNVRGPGDVFSILYLVYQMIWLTSPPPPSIPYPHVFFRFSFVLTLSLPNIPIHETTIL